MTSDSPFTILGIGESASEPEIRAAYARKLKIVRPDEDRVAFQRLVEARDTALVLSRLPEMLKQQRVVEKRPAAPAAQPPADSQAPEAVIELLVAPRDAVATASQAAPVSTLAHTGFKTDFGSVEGVSTPDLVLNRLRTDLDAILVARSLAQDQGLALLLLQLPVGAGTQVEPGVIRELHAALRRLKAGGSYPLECVDAFEQLAVMLVEFFDWQQSDRLFFQVLSTREASEFRSFLEDAWRQQRTAAQASAVWGIGQQNEHSVQPSMMAPAAPAKASFTWSPRLIFLSLFLLASLFRLGGGTSSSPNPELSRMIEEQQRVRAAFSNTITLDVDRDTELMLAHYATKPYPPVLVPPAEGLLISRYKASGRVLDALAILDKLATNEDLNKKDWRPHLIARAKLWLELYGWADRATCRRQPLAQVPDRKLEPAGAAELDLLFAKLLQRPWSAGDIAQAAMLQQGDQLVRNSQITAIAPMLLTLLQHVPQTKSADNSLRTVMLKEAETIQRCMAKSQDDSRD